MTGISHVWQALSVCLGLLARRSWSDVNTHASRTAHLYCFCHFLCLTVYEIVVKPFLFVEPEEGGACRNDSTDCGGKSSAWIAKPQQCELEMPAWNTPTDQRWNVLKICEKHLKHRCLADVSHNTSSSSDMVSCLSYSYANAQSGCPIQKHFQPLFFFFPSNQFTLERDKSLKSHIRGELEQMVIWTEKKKEKKKLPRWQRGSWGIAG